MNPLIIRGIIVFILFAILAFLSILLPASKKEVSEEPKEFTGISSSFFISGSDDKPSPYKSINFKEEDDTAEPTDKISLYDFLGKDTDIDTQNVTTENKLLPKLAIAELKKYGNEVGEINNKHLPLTLDQAVLLEEFITKPEDTSAREKLISLSIHYIDLSNDLLALEVPPSVSIFHKDFADVHNVIGNALKTLSENALTAENLLSYNKSPSLYVDVYLNLAQYLRVSGVRFDESEPGSLFTLPF